MALDQRPPVPQRFCAIPQKSRGARRRQQPALLAGAAPRPLDPLQPARPKRLAPPRHHRPRIQQKPAIVRPRRLTVPLLLRPTARQAFINPPVPPSMPHHPAQHNLRLRHAPRVLHQQLAKLRNKHRIHRRPRHAFLKPPAESSPCTAVRPAGDPPATRRETFPRNAARSDLSATPSRSAHHTRCTPANARSSPLASSR